MAAVTEDAVRKVLDAACLSYTRDAVRAIAQQAHALMLEDPERSLGEVVGMLICIDSRASMSPSFWYEYAAYRCSFCGLVGTGLEIFACEHCGRLYCRTHGPTSGDGPFCEACIEQAKGDAKFALELASTYLAHQEPEPPF